MTIHLNLPYLNYILDVISDIEGSLRGVSEDKFLKNKDIKEANLRRLIIIGKAVNDLPTEIKEKYKEVSWNKISDISKEADKAYFGVSNIIIWNLLKNNLPTFKQQILKIREELKKVYP